MPVLEVAKIALALAFLFYGYACVATPAMVREFERYGIPKLRLLVGWLEIAGGLGILVGYLIPILGFLATVGIALLMLGGVILRISIKDSFVQIAPAAILLVVACFVIYASIA